MAAHFAASMKLACEPIGKPSVRFSGGWIVLVISLTTARPAAAGLVTAPCPSLFASVSCCGFWWEPYGIGNARAIYIGGFRNLAVSPISKKPEASD